MNTRLNTKSMDDSVDARHRRPFRSRRPRRPRYCPSPARVGLPLLLIGGLFAGVSGCGGDARADLGEETYQRVINVEVLSLAPQDFQERVRLTGTVRANQDVTVSAEEAGVIREVMVERGSVVQQGQPLARIDDRILQSQIAEAEARAALARETWERRRRLFEDDAVGSELAYLEARYQAEQAQAQLDNLNERLNRTVVRAPLSGILEERMIEVGSMVSSGSAIGRIVQVDPVKVVGGVPERFAEDVGVGAWATVSFDMLQDEAYQGEVRYAGATVNPANRTFEVEVLIANPGRVIKPEMVAGIEIVRRDLEGVVVIPQEAVVRVEEGFVAFVAEDADEGPVARVRPITLGASQRNQVVVTDGLAAGDRLIVVGQNQVANGDRIQIVGTRDGVPAGSGAAESGEAGGDR